MRLGIGIDLYYVICIVHVQEGIDKGLVLVLVQVLRFVICTCIVRLGIGIPVYYIVDMYNIRIGNIGNIEM